MQSEVIGKISQMAKDMHFYLVELLDGVEAEDDSGNLTREYLSLTTALLGCKTVIDQMERMNANR